MIREIRNIKDLRRARDDLTFTTRVVAYVTDPALDSNGNRIAALHVIFYVPGGKIEYIPAHRQPVGHHGHRLDAALEAIDAAGLPIPFIPNRARQQHVLTAGEREYVFNVHFKVLA